MVKSIRVEPNKFISHYHEKYVATNQKTNKYMPLLFPQSAVYS